jgi:DNA repair protein RecN (Recombination protein N)
MVGEQSVNDLLGGALLRLEELVELDEGSQPLLERARSLQIELQDLGEEVGRLTADYDFDPEAIEAATERMNLWQELRRKYGGSVEAGFEQARRTRPKNRHPG